MPDVPTSLSKEEGLELIANERRIELAAEGFRSDDMYRYSDEYWNKHINNVEIAAPDVWGIERSGFFNGREKWAKGFENQRV